MQWKKEDGLKYAGSAASILNTEKKEQEETPELEKAFKYPGKMF